MTFRKTLWYFKYYWRPSWIFNNNCVIFDQVSEHEFPQNKKVILIRKVKFVCRLCTQTWCIIMIIVISSPIVAAILFLNFKKEKRKNRAWHGAHLESLYPNCVKATAWQILLRKVLQTLRMPFLKNGPWLLWHLANIVEANGLSSGSAFIYQSAGRFISWCYGVVAIILVIGQCLSKAVD